MPVWILDATKVGVDSTTLEADAVMKSIVRRDTLEGWEDYLRRLAAEDGVPIQSHADLVRYDKQRNQRGDKKVSNEEWVSPTDPDARIAKMHHLGDAVVEVVGRRIQTLIEFCIVVDITIKNSIK